MADLILRGGTVIDPASNFEGVADLAVEDGRISAIGPDLKGSMSTRIIDVHGQYVVPGLIDLHAHVYRGGTAMGCNVDIDCLRKGVTTTVDGGSAGAANYGGLRDWVIYNAQSRVLAFINLSAIGLTDVRVGELMNQAYVDAEGAVRTIREHPTQVIGIKVRCSDYVIGGPAGPLVDLARQAADETGTRLMCHIGQTVEPLPDLLKHLKPGDIITHCLTGARHNLLDENGQVHGAVREAVEFGIIFDGAHGRMHFHWDVTQRLLDQGFTPQVISTDLSAPSVHGPVFDLPTTMTKLLALGAPFREIVRWTTSNPAAVLGRSEEIGALAVGRAADVAVLQIHDEPATLVDSYGQARQVQQQIKPHLVLRNGEAVAGTEGH
ncbi:MAG TPA: amidohydrolase/deacetylase family metallohydrolase [Dehalococcoidia bacterium]|nr:amidohydrolase/deacetylase family metallohydrolase [Dehalococcoidia bacterium]